MAQPGYDGTWLPVSLDVEDPYDGSRLRVIRNIGGDPVEALYARGHIDDAQRLAATRFRAYHERAGARGARAIDYTREHVDGSPPRDPLPLKQAQAAKHLADARREIGQRAYMLIAAIAGDGHRVYAVAAMLGAVTERECKAIGKEFRDALTDLARVWKLST